MCKPAAFCLDRRLEYIVEHKQFPEAVANGNKFSLQEILITGFSFQSVPGLPVSLLQLNKYTSFNHRAKPEVLSF